MKLPLVASCESQDDVRGAILDMSSRRLLSLSDPPIVTLSIEPRSVLEGDRVTFTCQAHANPPIMGYRSAKQIKAH